MKKANFYKIEPYLKYEKFVFECMNKKYEDNTKIHNHHIIPKHIWNDSKNNKIVSVSIEDHIKMHILLSKCFDENTYEYISNLRSARIISKYSLIDKDYSDLINKSYSGEKNPFFMKKHTEEAKNKMSRSTIIQCKNISYEERYKNNAESEKKKRSIGVKKSWDSYSEEDKKRRSENISKALKYKNPAATPIIINDKRFESIKDATLYYNVSKYMLFKFFDIKKIK